MGGLGLLICEHDHLPGVYVKEVVQHKPAYLDKRVVAGDKLLAINGQNTSIASQDYVVQLLQVSDDVVQNVCNSEAELWFRWFTSPRYRIFFFIYLLGGGGGGDAQTMHLLMFCHF